ncbi:sce7725 family protein [Alkalimonas mucilaginosa]|uniref:Sce7725 family protein n=1 Tax=Alkalimonas mucilaginosa TaxID=3057676 RepID=A0ABU7JJQ8_9GAMM|nr:sce7725 family protein [Alkalimonas sp. MEB004]MEE2025933.1 sce7725 family protein [Alkalimonas sp. MEB004]
MYYPYFRGKQYDLITIRENAELLASSGFTPIVEPVKEALNGLKRTLDTVKDAGGELILIVNPPNGDHAGDSEAINSLLDNDFADYDKFLVGVHLSEATSLGEIASLCEAHKNRRVALIHAGFSDARGLAELIKKHPEDTQHIFLEQFCGKLYRKHFSDFKRILLRDGFKKRQANRLHPEVETFSDLHATYMDEGMNGFGDFLIVGDEFSETGGPAYSVAIHITFIDRNKDDEMHIYHFKSDRYDTPTDPAGKFQEALNKLCSEVENSASQVYKTEAIDEFISLRNRGHFPGLGYVKKLSMQHHIETLSNYFQLSQG